ncbi:MAG: hypothetical protein MR762_01020 [Clostridiales bacterium]|nr:hypothetical protein [Clostridiales bacterium]
MQMEPLPDDHARGESLKTKNTSAVQPSSTLKKYAKGLISLIGDKITEV